MLRSLFSFAVILPRKHRQLLNNKFPEWGIRFIDAADNADTESERYGTLRLFTGAYNEMYVRDISAKLRRTV